MPDKVKRTLCDMATSLNSTFKKYYYYIRAPRVIIKEYEQRKMTAVCFGGCIDLLALSVFIYSYSYSNSPTKHIQPF